MIGWIPVWLDCSEHCQCNGVAILEVEIAAINVYASWVSSSVVRLLLVLLQLLLLLAILLRRRLLLALLLRLLTLFLFYCYCE